MVSDRRCGVLALTAATVCTEERARGSLRESASILCLASNVGCCNIDHVCDTDSVTAVGTCSNLPVLDPLCCENSNSCALASGCSSVTCDQSSPNTWKDCVNHASGGGSCCASDTDCLPHQCATATCTMH